MIEADIAQLVEQLIRNQQVSGSTPLVGSIDFRHLHFLCVSAFCYLHHHCTVTIAAIIIKYLFLRLHSTKK